MPRTANSHRPLTGIAVEVGLALLAVGTPLALGGVHHAVIVLAALVACATTIALWLHRRPAGVELTRFAAILLAVTAFTALQLVPLPLGLLRLLAPATAQVLEVSLAGSLPAFHPISLDPGATLWEAVKIGSCALAFIAAHNHLRRRERRDRLLVALVAGGVLVTFLGFIGAVATPGRQLMLYAPETPGGGSGLITTSFVNPNHGAAFLTICAVIAVGLAVAARDVQRRVLIGLGAVLLGAGVFMTLSRGGIVGLAVGLGAVAVLLLVRRTFEGSRRWSTALVPGAMALILALSAWLAFDAIVAEFRHLRPGLDTSLGKIELWPSGLAMVLKNPWVGVGRGAFLTAFPRYLDGAMPATTTFSHLENQYLHLPAEWGLLVGTAVIAASIVALLTWLRRAGSSPKVPALAAALIAVAAHNLFDFNMETLGVALCVAVLAGALSGDRKERRHNTGEGPQKPDRRRWPRLALGAGVAGTLALTLVAALVGPRSADEDLAWIARLTEEKVPPDKLVGAVKAAVRRHPSDPWLPLAAGRRLAAERRPEALVWLNRAMFLFPKNPAIHLETARALRRFGRGRQALLEYRLALIHGASPRALLAEALPLARTLRGVLAALPERPEVQAIAVDLLLARRRVPLARELAARARKRWPRDEEVGMAQVRALMAAGEGDRAATAAAALAAHSETPAVFHLWARAMAGHEGGAVQVLREARKRFPAELSFDFALADAYVREKKIKPALQLAEAIMRQATATATLAQAHDLLARIHLADGRPHRARYEQEQARKLRGQ